MRKSGRFAMSLCAFVALATGCGGSQTPGAFPHGAGPVVHRMARITLPTYVIVMVQENRSVDNLFQKQPGVDTQNFGIDSHNNRVPLTKIDLGATYDCDHSHSGFVADVTEGFDLEHCGTTAPPDFAFSYVDPAQITQYTALATQYAFADEVLQSNEGPTFPAHLYLIAATSGSPGSRFNISENDGHHLDIARKNHPTGCDAPAGKSDTSIDMNTAFPGREGHRIYPCIDPVTILNELDSAHISWKYYMPELASLGNAPYAIQSLFQNDKAKVIVPETTILSDIQNGQLAHVSYVMPSGRNSDHPGAGNTGGPTWVASVVNALGASQYWNQCSIIVVWDDWGGLVRPRQLSSSAQQPSRPL